MSSVPEVSWTQEMQGTPDSPTSSGQLFEQIVMDLVGPIPRTNAGTYIFSQLWITAPDIQRQSRLRRQIADHLLASM